MSTTIITADVLEGLGQLEDFVRDISEFTDSPAGEALVDTDPGMVLRMIFEQSRALVIARQKAKAE